jgi:hypothetical protein
MAAYAVINYVVEGSAEVVALALETKLETLDSTTNPIRLISMGEKPGTNNFYGVLIYDGV